jgi:NADPH-dependent glutamate synthase beta subunit-like oxidoreductase
VGIPEHRLPREVLEAQINYIQDLGVEFTTGVTIGNDVSLEVLQKDYQAIFYAIGNQLSKRLSIPGSGLNGVISGLEFLRDIQLERGIKIKDRVLVIGGGNVAVDVALTTIRSGAKEVYLACVEPKAQMPGHAEEVDQAVEEGVILLDSWGPRAILGDDEGKVTGAELVCCVNVLDESGKFNPRYNERDTKTIAADMIVVAIGQEADLSILPQGMMLNPNGSVQIDPITSETTLGGVFAGGDITSGQAWVVEAIAAGRRASISIDRYLKGENLKTGRYLRQAARVKTPPREGVDKMIRKTTPTLPILERRENFKEVRGGFNEDNANLEAQRCMTCGSLATIKYVDDCMLCLFCERDCPQKAIYVSPEKKITPLIAWG